MNPGLISRTIGLLERQRSGDSAARDELASIAATLGEHADDGLGNLRLVLQEWEGMFSFSPGRPEGIDPLIRLLKFSQENPSADELALYDHEDWATICAMRGPVESVQMRDCSQCSTRYPVMGMSGFLDMFALVCGTCGDVEFRSDRVYKTTCDCGGSAGFGCPKCGSLESLFAREMNPYEYFATHRFKQQ